MVVTPHLLIGASVGIVFQNYPVVLILSFLSHLILDAIPHLEFSTFQPLEEREKPPSVGEMIFEICEILIGLAILAAIILKTPNWGPVLVGAFGATLTDLVDNVPFWSWRLRKSRFGAWFHRFHNFFHWDLETRHWYLGIPIYMIIFGALLWFFLKF